MSEFDNYLNRTFGGGNNQPHCRCLYEIENGLPRTIHCFMPCTAQSQILTRRSSNEWWSKLDDTTKKSLSENYTILTEEEIEKLHIADHRKNYLKKNDNEL